MLNDIFPPKLLKNINAQRIPHHFSENHVALAFQRATVKMLRKFFEYIEHSDSSGIA
jgi:hypothetical protein